MSSKHLRQVLLTLALASLSLSTPIPTRDPGSTLDGPGETLSNQTPAFDVRYVGEERDVSSAGNQTPAIDVAARADATVGQGGPNAIPSPDMERANAIVVPSVRRDQHWAGLDGAAAHFDTRDGMDLRKRTEDSKGGISITSVSGDSEVSSTAADLDPHTGRMKERSAAAAVAEVDGFGKSKRSAQASQDGWTGYPDLDTRDQHGELDKKRYKRRSLTKKDGSEWSSIDIEGSGKEARRGSEWPRGNDDTQGYTSLQKKRISHAKASSTRDVPDWDNTNELDETTDGDIIWLARARAARASDGNVDVQTKSKRTAGEVKSPRESPRGLGPDDFGWVRKRGGVPAAKRVIIGRSGSSLDGPRAMARRTRDPDEVLDSSYRPREESYGSGVGVARRVSKRAADAPSLRRKSVPNWDNALPGGPSGLRRRTDDYQDMETDSAIQMSGRETDTDSASQMSSAPVPAQKAKRVGAATAVDQEPDGWGADWNDGFGQGSV